MRRSAIVGMLALGCGGEPQGPPTLRLAEGLVVELGRVELGRVARKTLSLVNPLPSVLRPAASLEPPVPGLRLDRLPAAVAGLQSASFDLIWSPTQVGSIDVTLRISGEGCQDAEIRVRGSAVDRSLVADPPHLAFGSVTRGERSTLPLRISNQGHQTERIAALGLAPGSSGEFRVALSSVVVLPPGSSVSVAVEYLPSDAGEDRGVLVSSDGSGAPVPLQVQLSGRGVNNTIAVEPGAIDFESVAVGARQVRQARLINYGSQPVWLGAPQVAGPFGVETGTVTFPHRLAPAGALLMDVTFAPTTAGAAETAVSFTAVDVSAGATLSLTGQGRLLEPAVVCSPCALYFGRSKVGDRRHLWLENRSETSTTVALPPLPSPFRWSTNQVFLGPRDAGRVAVSLTQTATGAHHQHQAPFLGGQLLVEAEVVVKTTNFEVIGPRGPVRVSRDQPSWVQVWLPATDFERHLLLGYGGGATGPARISIPAGQAAAVPVSLSAGFVARTAEWVVAFENQAVAITGQIAPRPSGGLLIQAIDATDLVVVAPGAAPYEASGSASGCNPNPDWGQPGDPSDDPQIFVLNDALAVALARPHHDRYEIWIGQQSVQSSALVQITVDGIRRGTVDETINPQTLVRAGILERRAGLWYLEHAPRSIPLPDGCY